MENHSDDNQEKAAEPKTKPEDPLKGTERPLIQLVAFIGRCWALVGDCHNQIVALGTMGILIATSVYAVFSYLQWDTAKKSSAAAQTAAETAQKSLNVSSRAWLAPRNVYFSDDPTKVNPIKIIVEYQNVGESPALDVRGVYRFKRLPEELFANSAVNSIVEADNVCGGVTIAPGASVDFPKQPEGYKFLFGLPKDWIDKEILIGRKGVVVEMCFAYQTVGEIHHTSFSYFYRAHMSPGRQFIIGTAGNHAD